ncbi:unnamed protein product, partial [Urochloa humidicola]
LKDGDELQRRRRLEPRAEANAVPELRRRRSPRTSSWSSTAVATQRCRLGPSYCHLCTMDLPRPSLRLQQTIEEEDDSTLIRYLIAEDKPNYELLAPNSIIGGQHKFLIMYFGHCKSEFAS